MILPDGRAEWAFARQDAIHVVGCKGGSLATCSLDCEQNELPILDFQNDCFAACIIACGEAENSGSDDDAGTVVIIASVVGVCGLAVIAGGFALYHRQASNEKKEPLLSSETEKAW
jgi:hypothetical protein